MTTKTDRPDLTHKGWLGVAPIYCNDSGSDINARHLSLDWLQSRVGAAYYE